MTNAALSSDGIIDAETARTEALAGRLLLVDIRSPMEWHTSGVPDPAEAISMQDPAFLQTVLDKLDGDISRPVAIICATGARSGFLAGEMKRVGFSNVYDVSEGMMGSGAGPGWLSRSLPIRKPT